MSRAFGDESSPDCTDFALSDILHDLRASSQGACFFGDEKVKENLQKTSSQKHELRNQPINKAAQHTQATEGGALLKSPNTSETAGVSPSAPRCRRRSSNEEANAPAAAQANKDPHLCIPALPRPRTQRRGDRSDLGSGRGSEGRIALPQRNGLRSRQREPPTWSVHSPLRVRDMCGPCDVELLRRQRRSRPRHQHEGDTRGWCRWPTGRRGTQGDFPLVLHVDAPEIQVPQKHVGGDSPANSGRSRLHCASSSPQHTPALEPIGAVIAKAAERTPHWQVREDRGRGRRSRRRRRTLNRSESNGRVRIYGHCNEGEICLGPREERSIARSLGTNSTVSKPHAANPPLESPTLEAFCRGWAVVSALHCGAS